MEKLKWWRNIINQQIYLLEKLHHSNTPSFIHSSIPSFHHSIIPTFHHSITPSFHHSIIPSFQHSTIPSFQHSIIPTFHHSITPSFHHSITPSFHILRLILLLIFLSSLPFIQAQERSVSFDFLPSSLNFSPLKANTQEAKFGILYFPENRNLRVDIGNNVDLLKMNLLKENISIAAGIEFMGYALSTRYKEFRLQIDALDGFFGGNISLRKNYTASNLGVRLRIIHNSAHFVDGHYDFIKKMWIGKDSSIHFTRNFYELTIENQLKTDFGYFRYYGGFSHSFFVRPADIKRLNYHAGFEFDLRNLLGKFFTKDENIFIAHYFYLSGYNKYVGSQQTMLGLKLGEWEGKGITVYLSYYTGLNYFDAYYGEKISRFGIGFYVDFP